MDTLLILVILTLLGLCAGSFAGATVWRLRAKQLVEDKADGEEYDKKEYKKLLPLTEASLKDDRSRCLHCGHTLSWRDLIPLVSWVSTKGKCRYCGVFIGWFEPLMEFGTAVLFVTSYLLWPETLLSEVAVAQFALWLMAVVMLVILFAYDLKWFLLPDRIMFPLIGVGVLLAAIQVTTAGSLGMALLSLISAIFILSGLYMALWLISKGQWIGFGDVKLGLALALILSDWGLAFLALFAANFIGFLIVMPGLVMKKIDRSTRVPFGPLLIVGAIIALLFGRTIIDWYLTTFMWV